MDFLTVVTSEGKSLRHEIGAPTLRIGRSSSNHLVLQDLNVSRMHAEIVKRPEGFYVLDAGGKNGTFVNDRRIDGPTLLHPGDRVRVGTTTLIFNGQPLSPVELNDRPLADGPWTTILPGSESRTPLPTDMRMLTDAGTPSPDLATGGDTAGDAVAHEPISAAGFIPEGLSPVLATTFHIFVEADKELVFHRPIPELLETIMDLARRAVPFERGVLMLLEGGRLVSQVVRVPPDEAGRTISISRTITDRVVLNKESVLASDAQVDERFRRGQSVEAQHLQSVMCVPLWNNREVIGLIYVDSRHRAGLFTENSLRLLTHLANVAAIKIENARLFEQVVAAETMKRELEMAAEIQSRLLPADPPRLPGYVLCGVNVQCGAVGGDYFDYLPLPGGRHALALGDVAGKGMPAALLMCAFQASLRGLVELDLPPDETVVRLNRILCPRIPPNRFVTFFFGVLDPARHTLTYVNAGQTPPLVVRPDGAVERLAGTGMALGLFEKSRCEARTIALAPGEILVAYSDGVTEALSPAGAYFGEERLVATVLEVRATTPDAIVRRISDALDDHCAGSHRQDDTTMLVLKRIS